MLLRRLSRAAAVMTAAASLTGAGLAMSAGTASAVSCTSGWNCTWANASYTGGPAKWSDNTYDYPSWASNGACVAGRSAASGDTNGSWNDCISSLFSNESTYLFYWQNINCGGSWYFTEPDGYAFPNLKNDGVNDQFSSDC